MLLSRKRLLNLSRFLAFKAFPMVIAGAFPLAQLNAGPVTWIESGKNTNWTHAANWSTGAAPVNTDDVVIGTGTQLTSVDDKGNLTLNSLTIENNPYVVSIATGNKLTVTNALTLSNGTLTSAGTLVLQGGGTVAAMLTTSSGGAITMEGSFNATGGTLAINSGTLTLKGATVVGGTLATTAGGSIDSAATTLLTGVVISNATTVTVTGGTTTFAGGTNGSELLASSGSKLVIDGTTSGAVTNNGLIESGDGTVVLKGAIDNGPVGAIFQTGVGSVTLNGASVSGGALVGTINAGGTNTLTGVEVEGGVLTVTGGTTTFQGGSNAGILQASSGSKLIVNGTTSGAVTNYGLIQSGDGTVTLTGSIVNGSGAVIAQTGVGSVTLNGAAVTNGLLTGAIDMTGSTLSATSIVLGTVGASGTNTLTSVNVEGSGALWVTGIGTATFQGGTNDGTLSSSTGPGRILAIDGSTSAGAVSNYGIIQSGDGTATLTGSIVNGSVGTIAQTGSGSVTLTSASVFYGSLSGTMDATGTTSLTNLTSNATLKVDAGSTVNLMGAIANNGILDVLDTGTLQLTDGSSVTGGTIVNHGTGVVLSTGTVALNNTNVGGFDLTITGGTLTTNNGVNLTDGNTIRVDSGATLAVSSGNIVNNGGTLRIVSGGTVDPPAGATYTQNSGTLHLGGTLDVTSAIFNGGTVTGQGGFSSDASVTNNGVTLYVAGPNHVGTWGFDDFDQTSGGTLVFDVGSTTAGDTMNLAGSATLGGTIVLDPLGGWTDNPYDVLLITAADGITGTYASNLPYGLSLVLEPGTGGSESLYLQGQIPEPATGFLMLASLCGAAFLVRRRKARQS